MKNKVGFCVLLLLPLLIFGQANDAADSIKTINPKNDFNKRAYIGFSGGFSIPMGSFAARNAELFNSAFAKNGGNIAAIDAGFIIRKNFSARAIYTKNSNKVDEVALGKNLSSNAPNNYKVSASQYELNVLMIGVGVTKPSNSIDLDLHFLLGYGNSVLPSFNLIETDPQSSQSSSIQFPSIKEDGVGIGLSGGLRIHLNQYIDFISNASYLIFENTFEQLKIENNTTSQTSSKINYEILTINFGLAYRFLDL